jgi:hypothetical protein
MTTTDKITINVAGKKGYEIESRSSGTTIDVVRDGKPTTYYINDTFPPRKIVKISNKEGVEQSIETADDKVCGIPYPWAIVIGTISPIEREALSVIRDLYNKEKSVANRKALGMIYNNVLKDAKYGMVIDASTKGIPKIGK